MSIRILTALMVGALTATLPAQSQVDGFDFLAAPVAFKQIFPGLDHGPELDLGGTQYSGGVILDDLLFAQSATTPGNILATCDTCHLGDAAQTMLPGEVTIVFASVRDQVDLDVINGTGGGGSFTLTARDELGEIVAEQSVFVGASGTAAGVKHLSVRAPGIASALVSTALPQGYTMAIDSVRHQNYESVIVDLGGALAGAGGAPQLSLFGSLRRFEPVDLSLQNATPGAAAIPVLGVSAIHAPFKQGVMVPAPDVLLPGLPVSGSGTLDASFSFPPNVPAGFTVFLQLWMADAGAPAGFAASNALSATTPPS